MKPARLRPTAESDLESVMRYYGLAGGRALGERVLASALDALEPIQRMPGMGSRRLGRMCDVPGLRSWRVDHFPLVWLYFEAADHLDVVRLLGERQDIPSLMRWAD